ncbi:MULTISPECIES: sensor domain-containing diguanylate cyclase [Rhodopseudomonas]|uniref:Diguanylate cyclase n=1 Tax=Rhodopseudomonas palustris TaxID=1076 RepID=A0A0D7F403_RHOPL|nr:MULTISPECIES: sensor domain-containing diguanylate cyclase [Rhodopseudomonas]KIZ47784.1 diguanylate cyclase [Rhodopseudomonas palustris]MDF3814041.1 sensor domain-containing diguanylate cyclase [Rhodopseudomonas sp. BAL398]WOK16479.1 sensor domain-containing diguanylate cyclase [Rhodopseudomonas sp. BAL398]
MSDQSDQPPVSSDAEVIAALRAQLQDQAEKLREQTALLAHSRKIFDRASAAARIGVWECTLPDETLVWTDVVYDIFDLPRGSELERGEMLKCYPDDSARELHKRRSIAIEQCSGFSLDTEIVTVKGNRRWIRITASVESVDGVAVRIFGIKQDITDEKILADRNRYLAEVDAVTGLANRSRFQSVLLEELDPNADAGKPFGALLLIDLDEFKAVNDSFGHAVGDECLKQAGQRIRSACGDARLVARIGGDEFAVILGARLQFADISEAARAIVEKMRSPIALHGHRLQLGVSVGIALVDGCTPDQLFMMADAALYAAKAAGRNTFRIHKPGTGRTFAPVVTPPRSGPASVRA